MISGAWHKNFIFWLCMSPVMTRCMGIYYINMKTKVYIGGCLSVSPDMSLEEIDMLLKNAENY